MFCSKCGFELKEGENFCPKCGTPKREVIEEVAMLKNPMITNLQK